MSRRRARPGAAHCWRLPARILQVLVEVVNPFLFPLVLLYWHLVRPATTGVVVAVCCRGQVLLVRHSYGFQHWTLPGGGWKRGETLGDAARREVREELG